MNERHAKRQLRMLLRSFTPGSILHLMSDIFREEADAAAQSDEKVYRRCRMAEGTLFVVGLGLDAVLPQ